MSDYNDIAINGPYYDDFDAANNYLQMIFQPGRNIQARELTQIQTILQNQVSSFASHIFRDNSVVVNANVTYNAEYRVMTLTHTGTGDGTISNFVAQFRSNPTLELVSNNAIKAQITHVQNTSASNQIKVYFQFTEGGSIADTDSLRPEGDGSGDWTFDVTGDPDFALAAACDSGILYTEGRFVTINPQVIIVDSAVTGEYYIGLEKFNSVVTSGQDSTLLDPAAGFSNASSPGADRYNVSLELRAYTTSTDSAQDLTIYEVSGGSTVSYDLLVSSNLPLAADDSAQVGYDSRRADPITGHDFVDNFIELLVISNNQVIKTTDSPDYNEILNLLARRTYDESGNYTVDDLRINIEDHDSDPSLLTLQLLPGKAYVYGYEIDNQQITTVDLPKARDTLVANAQQTYVEYGQYVEIAFDDLNGYSALESGYIDFRSCEIIEFVDEAEAVVNATARAVGSKLSGNLLRIYITRVSDATGVTNSVKVRSQATPANTARLAQNNGAVEIKGTATSPIIEYNYDVVSSFTALDTDYKFSKIYNGTLIDAGGGNASVQISDIGGVFFDEVISLRTLDAVNGTQISLTNPAFTITYPGLTIVNIEAVINSGIGWEIGENVEIVVQGERTNLTFRNKTNTTVTERIVLNGSDDTADGADYFFCTTATTLVADRDTNRTNQVDGIRINSVTQPVNNDGVLSDAELTAIFRKAFNNGQTDYFYDYVRFTGLDVDTLKTNWTAVTDTYYNIEYEYYAHDTNGTNKIFAPNSYSNFDEIGTYTTQGGSKTYKLTNCLDFRPSIDDIANAEFPLSETRSSTDVTYYLPRLDKVYISDSGELGINEGISSLNPELPDDIDGTMSIFTLALNPYTFTKNGVSKQQIQNRRYTMRDIGEIDRRLRNVEEYSALTLLEKKATDLLILDQNGFDKFKSGIFVDSFYGYETHNVNSPLYRMVLNTNDGTGRTPFTTKFIDFDIDESSLTNMTAHDNTITLAYTEEVMVQNTYASSTVNLQPYLFYQWNGTVSLIPSVDNWFDEVQLPAIIDNRTNTTVINLPAPTVEPVTPIPSLPQPDTTSIIRPLAQAEFNAINSRWVGTITPNDQFLRESIGEDSLF